jgi:ribosome biogenesis protein MAK21
LHQPSFVCGVFYLIRELEKTFTGLQSLLDQPEDNESDGEEIFRDVPDEDDEQPAPIVETKSKPTNGYDPRKRDPEHSNADKTCLWELVCSFSALSGSTALLTMFLSFPTHLTSTPLSP